MTACPGSSTAVNTRQPTGLAVCAVCRQPVAVTACPTGWGGAVLAEHDAPVDLERSNRLARTIRGVARMVAGDADLIATDGTLGELCAELAGVLDIRDGLAITNPEDRLRAHLRRIDELVDGLPLLDGGAR